LKTTEVFIQKEHISPFRPPTFEEKKKTFRQLNPT